MVRSSGAQLFVQGLRSPGEQFAAATAVSTAGEGEGEKAQQASAAGAILHWGSAVSD